MLDVKLRGLWDRLMRPVGAAIGRAGFSPNAVTLISLAIQVVVAVLIVEGRLLAAGVVGAVAALADGFDGAVAKARGLTTKFGAVLDSTTDRLVDALFLIPIAWLYGVAPDAATGDQSWVAAVALVALVAAFLVSYVRARAEALGVDAKVGIAERAERTILILAGLILDLLPVTIPILAGLSTITFLQRLMHVRARAAGA